MPVDNFCDATERIACFLKTDGLGLISFDLQVHYFCETDLDQFIDSGSLDPFRAESETYNPLFPKHPVVIDNRDFNTAGVISAAVRKASSLRQVRIQYIGEFHRSVPAYFLANLIAVIALEALCGFRPLRRIVNLDAHLEKADLRYVSDTVWCPQQNDKFLETFYDKDVMLDEMFEMNFTRKREGQAHIRNLIRPEIKVQGHQVMSSCLRQIQLLYLWFVISCLIKCWKTVARLNLHPALKNLIR